MVVSSSLPAKVKVVGKAKIGGQTVKLGGASKKLKPGKLGRYKVALPQKLRAALASLPRSRSITVTFTASAKNVVGKASKDTAKVTLPGRR